MDDTPSCGYDRCGRPLQPNGASLYFCPPHPGQPESQSCQARWWERQQGRTATLRYENHTGAPSTVAAKPHIRAKAA